MAYVKILRNRNVVALEEYLFNGRDCDDPLELSGCMEGFVSEQFIGTQMSFGERENFDAIHIIQSWNESDSAKIAPEQFAKIGKKMVENLFPGHDFCVVTHTEHGHVHNHIMVNPVHSETGRRIHDKKRVLYEIQSKSDELCLENGLSVIEAQSKKNWEKMPEHIREMKRKGGFSWVLDLKEKADFARSIATSFDEYSGVLNQFGIQVKVENKTIGYFYPNKRQKRGDTYGLGERYTKNGLIEQFRKNYVCFYEAGLKTTPIEKINFSEHWKFHRSNQEFYVPSYRYKQLVIPHELIRSIQGTDIKTYGEDTGQKFHDSNDGSARLVGKPHILFRDNRWINETTKTEGGAFEFINYLHDESWLATLKRFDISGKVEDVQKLIENRMPSFQAFHVPKPFRKPQRDTKDSLKEVFFEASKILNILSKDRRVQTHRGSKVKFISQDNPRSSITVHKKDLVWFTRSNKGVRSPFFSKTSLLQNSLVIFENPVSFLSVGKKADRILSSRQNIDVLVPLQPLEEFLEENKEYIQRFSKCWIVRGKELFYWGPQGKERVTSDGGRTDLERIFGVQYRSLEDLLKELIIGRSI